MTSPFPGLYTSVAGLIDWANAQLADEHTDAHEVAEILIDKLSEVRDLLGSQLPTPRRRTTGETVVQTMGTVESGATVIGINRRTRRPNTEGKA